MMKEIYEGDEIIQISTSLLKLCTGNRSNSFSVLFDKNHIHFQLKHSRK